LRRGDFTPRVFIQSPKSPSSHGIGKSKSSPLMNAADTDQESVIGKAKPLTIADIGRDRKKQKLTTDER
jgi:hypothetical protein